MDGNSMNRDADGSGAVRVRCLLTDTGANSTDTGPDTHSQERDQLAEKIHSTDGVSRDQARQQITSFEDRLDALDDLPGVGAGEDSPQR
jgi:hypothetical protein